MKSPGLLASNRTLASVAVPFGHIAEHAPFQGCDLGVVTTHITALGIESAKRKRRFVCPRSCGSHRIVEQPARRGCAALYFLPRPGADRNVAVVSKIGAA